VMAVVAFWFWRRRHEVSAVAGNNGSAQPA
jgi:hypothetical protein